MVPSELIDKLKKCKYSKKRVRKFKNLVRSLEKKLRGSKKITVGIVNKYNMTPTEFFIPLKILSNDYIVANNTLKKFSIIHSVKTNKKIIPVHINNKVSDTSHLNLLIIIGRRVFRIDPGDPLKTKIKTKNVDKTFTEYFNKRGFEYSGMYSKNKIIKHGGLCRYVSPLVYVYGKSLTRRIIKKEIINYFEELINLQTFL